MSWGAIKLRYRDSKNVFFDGEASPAPGGGAMPEQLSTDDWLRLTGGLAGTGFSPDETLNPGNASALGETFDASAGVVISQPAVKNGIVYFGDGGGYCYAYATNGSELWSTFLSDAGGGIAGSPAVADVVLPDDLSPTTLVFLGAGGDDDADQADLFALNGWDGTIVWQTPLSAPPGNHIYSSPAVFDGSVYVGVSSVDDAPLVQGLVVKLNSATGEIEETFKVVPDGSTGGGVWGSVTIDETERTLYVATGNEGDGPGQDYAISVVKLNADTLAPLDHWRNTAGVGSDEDFGSTPTLFEGTVTSDGATRKLVGVGSKDGNYYVFDRSDLASGPVASLAIAGGGSNPFYGGVIAPGSYNGDALLVSGPGEPTPATLTTDLGTPNAELTFTSRGNGTDGRSISIEYAGSGPGSTTASASDDAITVGVASIDETIAAVTDEVNGIDFTAKLSGAAGNTTHDNGGLFVDAQGSQFAISQVLPEPPTYPSDPQFWSLNVPSGTTVQATIDWINSQSGSPVTAALHSGADGSAAIQNSIGGGSYPVAPPYLRLVGGIDGALTGTADDVLAAIEADTDSDALVIVAHAPDNDGSGIVSSYGPTNLTGGNLAIVRAYDPNDLSAPVWEMPLGGFAIGPIISTPYIVCVPSDGIYVFRASDGEQLAQRGSGQQLNGGASLAGHVVYFGDPAEGVYGYSAT